MKKIWFGIIVVACLMYFPVAKEIKSFCSHNELENKSETFSGDSTLLQHTAILPTFDSPIVPAKNNIWCSSFQLAWNEMKDVVIQEPIKVIGEEQLSQRLNTAKQSKSDVAEASCYIAAGKASDGILQTIQSDMAEQFPHKETPVLSPTDGLVAYSYIETYLKFTHPFRQSDRALVFIDSNGNQTPLGSFGVWDGYHRKYKPLCEQIDLLYCKTNENFQAVEYALDLCKDTEPYQVVVAVIDLSNSLEETFNNLQNKIQNTKNHTGNYSSSDFKKVDILIVPELCWDITHHFSDLENMSLANQNFQGMPITTAAQSISFRLDRSGVILKSESLIGVAAIPREFIFDKPFLLYLKKRDAAQPFFVMWVDNAELLTPFKK